MPPRSPQHVVHAFEAQRRRASLTGQLLGLDLPARDAVLHAQLAALEQRLAQARERATATGEAVDVDGSGASLTDGHDTWRVHPDGRLSRVLQPFPGFEACLEAGPETTEVPRTPHLSEALPLLYQAFWAPSATNWQPTRVLVGPGGPLAAALRETGAGAAARGLRLLLLRRDRYESLLGDVLEPFGLAVTAREESIDAGIFAQTLRLAATAAGHRVWEHVLTTAEVARLREPLLADLTARLQASGPSGEDHDALAALRRDVAEGRYLADAVVDLAGGPSPRWPAFEALVAAHSTQRVAAPGRELPPDRMRRLWEDALASLPEGERAWLACAAFSWHDKTPRHVGQAMFEALYGRGADPETRLGGEGGLLTQLTVGAWLRQQAPAGGAGPEALPQGWQALPEAALRRAVSALPVPAERLGTHLRDRLLRDGKWHLEDGLLRDDQGRPLTVPVLVRLLRSLAGTFGHFFLKFQNTHPCNAFVLARADGEAPHHAWRAVGRVAATMTFAARAQGLSSIVKTGPIDLARDAIGAILAANPDQAPVLAGLSGAWLPALTFQVGWPLAGGDVVEGGAAQPHTGLEERRRDKRPPRGRFAHHIWAPPSLE
ncbi:MAG: hypothetical protein VKQ33_08305 [Candidatus Sericytochromatia bacterium]|nr:hypothetical protein [Candidatus Sericytochromatia bacterium]